jgi:hypothetical protein
MPINEATINQQHPESFKQPVCAVSSSSSLDSFVMGLPTHWKNNLAAADPTMSEKENSSTSSSKPETKDETTQQPGLQRHPGAPVAAAQSHTVESSSQQPSGITSSIISPAMNPSTLPGGYLPAMLPPMSQIPILQTQTTGVMAPGAAASNSIPEFLYQLTKMLSGDNRGIIEWSNGT